MAEIHRHSRADRRQPPEMIPAIERRLPRVRDLELHLERKSQGHVILRMANEFVAQNHYLFDEVLERLSPHGVGPRIELEMSDVPYADSEALGRLLFLSKKLAHTGASLVLVNPTPYVTNIIEMVHLDKALTIVHLHTFPQSRSQKPEARG